MKLTKTLLALLLAFCMAASLLPGSALAAAPAETLRSVQSSITIDEDPEGGYEGDYVVIYNPATSMDDARSTGTMTGLIETGDAGNTVRNPGKGEDRLYCIDVDAQMEALAQQAGCLELPLEKAAPKDRAASFKVGDTRSFEIYGDYSPTGSSTVEFKCLYVGEHCYIWTPTEDNGVTYPLDTLGEDLAGTAAAEFDSKYDLMRSSFGDHIDFETGDNRLHMLYYNINEGWSPGKGYVGGFFYAADLYRNYLPILNIDTYPGVIFPDYYGEGKDWLQMSSTYSVMVHEYQHLINFSNNAVEGYAMPSWLNESFSAAAEEICYPGSSVVSRIQSWENYFYSANKDWLSPPAEFEYQPDFLLHNGYSLYDWNSGIPDVLALYAQVSMFAQYLFTRYGNTVYRQISSQYEGDAAAAITAATGVDCSTLAKEFRVAVTANAALDQYGGIYGFRTQEGYDPAQYHDVENPWELLGPVVFTGESCSVKGGGAITVKPVGGVYVPPADADAGLEYVGVKLAPRPSFSVSFSVGGEVIGSESALKDDGITLPAAVSAEIEGWSFIGWTERDVAETAEAPAYYAPGASYAVTGDVTLYALFTHTGSDDALYTTSPVTRHTPTLVPAVAPSCTEPGSEAYYFCDGCGKYFAEESCETEITPQSAQIPKLDHDYQVVAVTPPTCTEQGYTTYACTRCTDSYQADFTDPAGHAPGEPVKENETDPTCTEPGGYDTVVYCTVCKAELSREHTELAALDHDWGEPTYQWAEDYSACTATRVCKRDESHVETETVQTSSAVTKPATLEEEGEIIYTAVFKNEAFGMREVAVPIPKLEPPTPVNPFDDVKDSAYYYEPVLWAVNHDPQITNGTGAATFSPEDTCTRGQVVTFLWRAKGCPEPTSTENPFKDVKDTDYFYKAVLWAKETGVTTGSDATHFSPNDGCTRAQVVTFLWRAEGSSEATPGENELPIQPAESFADVPADAYYSKAVLWAVAKGVTNGTDPGKFSPNATCTRGQIVTFLYRDMA